MPPAAEPVTWMLSLYVSGAGPHSAAAIATIRALCNDELAGRVHLQIVDVNEEPAHAVADHVLAVPTLIKREPPPLRRLVGDLSDTNRLREGLDLVPRTSGLVGRAEAGAP